MVVPFTLLQIWFWPPHGGYFVKYHSLVLSPTMPRWSQNNIFWTGWPQFTKPRSSGASPLLWALSFDYNCCKNRSPAIPKLGEILRNGLWGKGKFKPASLRCLGIMRWGNVICPSCFYGIQRKPTFFFAFFIFLKKKKSAEIAEGAEHAEAPQAPIKKKTGFFDFLGQKTT